MDTDAITDAVASAKLHGEGETFGLIYFTVASGGSDLDRDFI
jgi:hypothetical protein